MIFISEAIAQDTTSSTQQPPPPPPGAGGPPPPAQSLLSMFFPMIAIGVVFYFLVFRPNKKQQMEKAEMIKALKAGDDVITSSGIFGKISSLADNHAMVQVANNVVLKIDRSQLNVINKTS